MKRRLLEIQSDGGTVDAWHFDCPTCPKWSHQDALKVAREQCVAGIITNVQGAVPLKWCDLANKNTNFDTPDGPHIECMFDGD